MENLIRIGAVRLLATIAVVSLVSACSTLKGQRFKHEEASAGQALAGVPFTLNRPVPSVTRTQGGDGVADKFEISFEYLPDPDGRFTLQIDPALLSSVDFNVALDANGSMTETTAKTTDQTAPLIVAMGKLVATGAALDRTTVKDIETIGALKAAGDDYFAADGSTIPDPASGMERRVNAADRKAWTDMLARMRKEADEGPIKKNFVYVSAHEHALLQGLLKKWRHDSQINGVAPAPAPIPATAPAPAPVLVVAEGTREKEREIQGLIANLEKRKLAKIRAELIAERRKLRAAYAMAPGPDRQLQLDDNYKLVQLTKTKLPEPGDLLVDLADLQEAEWQRRLVAYLNRKIALRRHLVRVQASTGATPDPRREAKDTELNYLLARKAVVLGVGAQRQRRMELARMLERARLPRELQVFREEIAALEAMETAAENALKAPEKELPEAEEPVRSTLLGAPHGTVVSSDWIIGKLGKESRPFYVVALQPLKATTYEAEPAQNPAAAPSEQAGQPSAPPVPPTVPAQDPAFPVPPQGTGGQPVK